MIKKNIGSKDRLIRLAIALGLFFLAYWKWNWVLFGAALFVLFEATFSWCIFYQLTGRNSCNLRC